METLHKTNFDSEVQSVLNRLEAFSERAMSKPNVDKRAVLGKLIRIVDKRFQQRVYIYSKYTTEKEKNWNLRDGKYGWGMLSDITEQERVHGLTFDEAFLKITRNATDNERKQINKNIATLHGYLQYSTLLIQQNGNPQMLKPQNQTQSKEEASTQETQSTGTLLKNIFKDEATYQRVMNTLVEHKYCIKGLMDLYTWTHREKGNKTQLCTLLYLLNSKGYFKQRYSDSKLKEVALNTFGVSISLRTFQRKEEINALTPRFAFIA